MATSTFFSGMTRAGALDRRATLIRAGDDSSNTALKRGTPEYLPTLLSSSSSSFIILYKLRPLVAKSECSNARLVRISAETLAALLRSLPPGATLNPVVLATDAATGETHAALDASDAYGTAEEALTALAPLLPTAPAPPPCEGACCTPGAAPRPVTYALPDGRELLFGPFTSGLPARRAEGSRRGVPPYLLGAGAPPDAPLPLASLQPHDLAWPLPFADVALYGAARAIYVWHGKTRFCGSCGRPTEPADGGVKRVCTGGAGGCKETAYPRTDAVAITLVQSPDGMHCLLGRQPAFPPSFYSCLAGFVEAGESIEEAAGREVWEESGVRVDKVAYYASQPWPLGRGMYGQVMLGFLATAAAGQGPPGSLPTILVDRDELEDARWWPRAEVAAAIHWQYREVDAGAKPPLLIPGPYAIAHQLLKAWVDGHAEKLTTAHPHAHAHAQPSQC